MLGCRLVIDEDDLKHLTVTMKKKEIHAPDRARQQRRIGRQSGRRARPGGESQTKRRRPLTAMQEIPVVG